LAYQSLSFKRATLFAKVICVFTRDQQALPGHLVAFPERLQALAAVNNLSLTDPDF